MPVKISVWDEKYPILFIALRVALGMILVIRGIFFLTDIQPLFHLINNSSLSRLNINKPLALLICWVHLLGGTFIILGLLTRISAWAQVPIMLGAIIFVNLNYGSPHFSELLLAVIVLILSIRFGITGAGKFSMDYHLKGHLL